MIKSGLRADILLSDSINFPPDVFQVWIYILLNVNVQGVGRFSQREISEATNINLSSVNRSVLYLCNLDNPYNPYFEYEDKEFLKQVLKQRLKQHLISGKHLYQVLNNEFYYAMKRDLKQVLKQEIGHNTPIKESKPKKEKVQKEPSLIYKQFIEIYDTFIMDRTSCPGDYNAREGDCANKLITYLKSASKGKSDDAVLKNWEFILMRENWDKLEPYHKERLKLSQIQENIVNILNQIRNGSKKGYQPKPTVTNSELNDHIDKMFSERESFHADGTGADLNDLKS